MEETKAEMDAIVLFLNLLKFLFNIILNIIFNIIQCFVLHKEITKLR